MSPLSISTYKQAFESKLPKEELVIERNKTISSIYAELYLNRPEVFKWAGMASFASNHVGIGLLPYHFKKIEITDVQTACGSKSIRNDFNLLRYINNRIYDDIAWTHQAFLDGGIELLRNLMIGDQHYENMLLGWEALDEAIEADLPDQERRKRIWAANAILLRHEQEMIVQELFDQFGALFKKLLSFCASLNFSPDHFQTDFKYHSSFLWYTYLKQFRLLKESFFIPDLTKFEQRWNWLENKVMFNWVLYESNDKKHLVENLRLIYEKNLFD